jgi:hypothetical protein
MEKLWIGSGYVVLQDLVEVPVEWVSSPLADQQWEIVVKIKGSGGRKPRVFVEHTGEKSHGIN